MVVLFRFVFISLLAVQWGFVATAGEVPAARRVLVIVTDDCPRCDRELERLKSPGGTFETLRRAGWKIGETDDNHIQIARATEIGDQIKDWGIKTLPAVVCVRGNEIERTFKEGCGTPLDPYTFGWLYKGVDERKAPVKAEPVTVKTSGHYPLRGNHWNIEGDWFPSKDKAITHLRGSAHVNLIPTKWKLESWSEEEILSLHDDLHENNAPLTGMTRPNTIPSTSRMQAFRQAPPQSRPPSSLKPSSYQPTSSSNSSYASRFGGY